MGTTAHVFLTGQHPVFGHQYKHNSAFEFMTSVRQKVRKQINTTKFDSSVDLHIRLGVDPKKADQAIRGTVTLPHGTGKTKRVLVLCTPEKEADAKSAGADYVGLDEFVQKIEGGWVDVDVIIATPAVMPKIGKLGKVLGPRNLMPNPKTGTVTNDVAGAVIYFVALTGFATGEVAEINGGVWFA